MPTGRQRKSGQAIIFLMVVLVIGTLAVVWNFDLHRVVSAKLRMRNAGDAAALAGARWQGYALNMIGDLNLIQAAIVSMSYEDDTNGITFYAPDEAFELHELRSRLEVVGPLGAFAVAQQTAFNNGALPDPDLAENLLYMAEELRDEISDTPYDNAWDEYADLLENLVARGVAVGSYSLYLPRRPHPLLREDFYAAIAQAQANWWCAMRPFDYYLENYEDHESWPTLPSEFRYRLMFDLMLDEFSVEYADDGWIPPDAAIPEGDEYGQEFAEFLGSNDVIMGFGDPDYAYPGIVALPELEWHVYHSDPRNGGWDARWPRPAEYDDVVTRANLSRVLAIRERVKPEYDYLGAVAGISMAAPVSRGILSSSGNPTVDLSYRAKAKPFGVLDFENDDAGVQPPHYFGFVFPCFDQVRLVHSDIGYGVFSGPFYDHITRHLQAYLDGGTASLQPDCSYCRLLVAWETLDRREGLEWLDRAYSDDVDNPCRPEADDDYDPVWGETGGGATGGS